MKNNLVLFFVLICAGVFSLRAENVVKIGVILPLTGNSAHLGERFQKTIKLFEQGRGITKHKYEIIVEDDGSVNRDTMLAAQRLISLNHVNAIVTWAAGAGNTVAQYTQQKGVLHFNISLDPKVAKGEYNFLHWVDPYSQAEMMFKILEKKHVKNIVIIGTRQQAILFFAKLTEVKCIKSGVKVKTMFFNPGERDFRTPLTSLRFDKPDAIVLGAFSPEQEILLRQLHEVGVGDVPVVNAGTFDFISDRTWIENRPYVSSAAPSPEWSARFEKLYGAPPSFAEPYLYDILKILVDAYEHTSSTDNLQAASWIMKLKDYPTEVGPISADSEGILWSKASYYTTKNGIRTFIKFEDIK